MLVGDSTSYEDLRDRAERSEATIARWSADSSLDECENGEVGNPPDEMMRR